MLTWRWKKPGETWGDWKEPAGPEDTGLGPRAAAAFMEPDFMHITRVAFKAKDGAVYEYKKVPEDGEL